MTKKKETDIAKSEAGLALQQLLLDNGAIDIQALNALLKDKGIKAVATGIQEARESRVATQREWATVGRELTKEEKKIILKLPKVMGMAPAIDEPRKLTQEEIDEWAEELLIERQVADMLNGLKDRMRGTFINAAAAENDGDPLVPEPVEFKSPLHGYKIVVSTSESSSDPDLSKLEEVVDPEVWNSITDTVETRVVNEQKLTQAIAEGKITMEQFIELVPDKKRWNVVSPKKMKAGEDL